MTIFLRHKNTPKKDVMDRYWKDNISVDNYLALICLIELALFLPFQLLPLKVLTDLS